MSYRQLSEEDRQMIAAMKTWGWSMADIAEELGRHRSTVYREVKRNCVSKGGWYGAALAGERTRGRRSRSRRNLHYGPAHFAPIEAMLRADFSPEQIVGRLSLEGVKVMSHETIYRWIWADKKRGGALWLHLRGARKQRRKRYGRYDSRGRLAGKKMIGERPAVVAERKRFGDWEIDTVHGRGKPCVVTVVERKSGLTRLGKLSTASGKDTLERTSEILQNEAHPVHTVTADNGTEFHIYKELEARLNTQVYFANTCPAAPLLISSVNTGASESPRNSTPARGAVSASIRPTRFTMASKTPHAIGPLPAASFSLLSSEAAQSLHLPAILLLSHFKVETILRFHFSLLMARRHQITGAK
jgi:IS30 family transposase